MANNVGFVKGTKFVLPVGECSDVFILKDIECVRLSISNGGYIICGKNQEILLDDGFREAIDCYNGSVGGERIDGVELCGKMDTYDVSILSDEHTYGIMVKDNIITVHNLPNISTVPGASHGWFKYVPYKKTEVRTIVKKRLVDKKVKIDQSNLIKLGGIFEEIGGQDEAVGGGSQKVGANIQ